MYCHGAIDFVENSVPFLENYKPKCVALANRLGAKSATAVGPNRDNRQWNVPQRRLDDHPPMKHSNRPWQQIVVVVVVAAIPVDVRQWWWRVRWVVPRCKGDIPVCADHDGSYWWIVVVVVVVGSA